MSPEAQRIAIAKACGRMGDYYSSLDDMHEAEKTLNEDMWMSYLDFLGLSGARLSQYVNKSASHKAEAFIRAIGKWDDSK